MGVFFLAQFHSALNAETNTFVGVTLKGRKHNVYKNTNVAKYVFWDLNLPLSTTRQKLQRSGQKVTKRSLRTLGGN